MEFVIQAIGILGAVFAFLAYQCNVHRKIMIFKTLCEGLFALQFVLLGAYTGFCMNLVGSIRNLLFAYLIAHGKKTTPYVIIFVIIGITLGCITWVGPLSILAICGKCATTIAFGFKNPQTVRFLALPSSVCWIVYDSIYYSIGGILTESFTMISIAVATIAYYKAKKHEKCNNITE